MNNAEYELIGNSTDISSNIKLLATSSYSSDFGVRNCLSPLMNPKNVISQNGAHRWGSAGNTLGNLYLEFEVSNLRMIRYSSCGIYSNTNRYCAYSDLTVEIDGKVSFNDRLDNLTTMTDEVVEFSNGKVSNVYSEPHKSSIS